MLREARLARGLNLAAAAEELCIRPVYLEALEAGRAFELVLGYARGFLRAYARHVGLDPAPLLAALLPPAGPRPPRRTVMRRGRVVRRSTVVTAASLALVAAAYAGRHADQPGAKTAPAVAAVEPAAGGAATPSPTPDPAPVSSRAPDGGVGDSADAAATPAAASTPAAHPCRGCRERARERRCVPPCLAAAGGGPEPARHAAGEGPRAADAVRPDPRRERGRAAPAGGPPLHPLMPTAASHDPRSRPRARSRSS